jgi:APA family basic amino acid/polyamine antiporter
MARRGDLPRLFSNLTGRGNPALAILAVGASILALVLTGNIETVWSFSAFTVLIYYAITNIAALRLNPAQRLYPRWISAAGLLGCLALAAFIPVPVWLAGAGLLALGLGVRYFMNRRTAAPDR